MMKRYEPGLNGPCPELERAVMQECPDGEYVKVDDVLCVIKGCWDYGGGYHGNDEHMAVYRHGMQTVLNAMNGAVETDGDDLQSDVLLSIGRKTNESIKMLIEERDAAIKHIAEWCVAIDVNGTGWDDWDEYYKDAMYREKALPEIRTLLTEAIEAARKNRSSW